MLTSSCKAKGRNLQKYVVTRILAHHPELQQDDCTSRSMGCPGVDVLLSPKAQETFPISIECKSHAKYGVYKDYQQANTNRGNLEPIVVIKQNNSKPLAVMDLDFFLRILYEAKV
jgi:hypothetical protein